MKIELVNAGKRYNREWIFRNAKLQFESGNSYAITGPNGSGKSTFLQAVGGILGLSEGSVVYSRKESIIEPEAFYRHISFCAPYLDVIEEMTITEFFDFHNRFQPFIKGLTVEKIIATIGLDKVFNKQIRFYSSGMKQRVKLAQAIFSNTAVILLDEPCTNLDAAGINLYHTLIQNYCAERLVIICSNDEIEYSFCKEVISIQSYKDNTSLQSTII